MPGGRRGEPLGKTVLLVDDDALFRAAIGDGLRAAGYNVAVAANGLEALERIREAPPDFVLLDLIMPKLDGSRTCRLLKGHPEQRNIPVILLTGVGRERFRALGELGAEAAVPKRQVGVTLSEVLETLTRLESARREPAPIAVSPPDLPERRIVTELLAERQHTEALLAALGEGVVELDDEGHVLYGNPAALAMLGCAEGELLGRPGSNLLGPANVPALAQALHDADAGNRGQAVRLEVPYGEKTIGVTLTALPRPEGTPGALLILREIPDIALRARSFQALAAVAQQVVGELDLSAVLREIVARTAELLEVERVALFRVEQTGNGLRLRCTQSLGLSERHAQAELSVAPGEGAVGRAVAERRAVSSSDLLQDPTLSLSADLRAFLQAERIGAVLAVPILLGDETFGVLTVNRPAGQRFTTEEVELVTSLAGSAAIAIQNARLFQAEQARRRQLEAVRAVTGEILRELDLPTLLGLINRRSVELLGATSGVVFLWDEDARHLIPQAWHGRGEWMREVRPALGQGIGGLVAQRREGLIVNDYRSWSLANPVLLERTPISAIIAEPLLYRDRLLGVITIDDHGTGRTFTAQNRDLLALFANQAAIAMENARLYAEADRRRRVAEAVTRVSRMVTAALDLETVTHGIARAVVELLDAPLVRVHVHDPVQGRLPIAATAGEEELVRSNVAPPKGLAPVATAAFETGTVQCVVPIEGDSRFLNQEWAARHGLRMFMALPLWAGGMKVGVLSIHRREARPLMEEEHQVLSTFADQAAIAIQNARLYQGKIDVARRQAALLETGAALNTAIAHGGTLQLIIDKAVESLGADKGALFAFDHATQELHIVAARGLSAEGMGLRVRQGESVAGRAVLWRRPVAIPDVDADTEHDVRMEYARREGIQALLVLPVAIGDEVAGAISLYHSRPTRFSQEDIALFSLFAQQAAVAMENARLYEGQREAARNAERQRARAEALAAVGQAISASLDLDEILVLLVDRTAAVTGADAAAVLQRDPATGIVQFRAAHGLSTSFWKSLKIPPGVGIVGAALATGRPQWTPDIQTDPRFALPEEIRALNAAEGVRGILSIPVRGTDAAYGVLNLYRRGHHAFDEEEITFAARIAEQAAVAIQNARLYAEVRKAYKELQAAQEQLVQVEKLRALGEMAGGVAHDFNNILAIILARAELLRIGRADLQQGLQIIERAALDGAETVRRILGFAGGRPEVAYDQVDLPTLLEHVVEVTRPRWKDEAQRRGALIEVVLTSEPVPMVWGNAAELREALVNLVFNAVDAMPQGGRLTVGARRPLQGSGAGDGRHARRAVPAEPAGGPGGFVEIFVRDTGVGMSEAVRSRAFEPFFTTKGTRGSGLGLAMVYGIAKRHGGQVLLESREGAGTMVTLRLSLAARAERSSAAAFSPLRGRAGRIVVVDDEEPLGQVLAELLRLQGHEVEAFTDPGKALEHLVRAPADLLFTDLGMPAMSGWEVLRRARALRPDLPIVLVTGWGEQLDPEQVRAQGASALVAKPYRMETILSTVAELLPSPSLTGTSKPALG